jgi:flagellar hook-associated protein 3 FlgL
MSNISTLGQQINLVSRMKDIQSQMTIYQQQVTTGVKFHDFKQYGADALKIQRYRTDLDALQGYGYNIDAAQVNIQQMDGAIQENLTQAQNILKAIGVQMARGSDFDLESIQGAAKTALEIVEANMNTKVGDRYIFAGSDVTNKPYPGSAAADNNIEARVTDWLDGTVDTDTFLAGINGMSDSEIGYSTTLQSAKNIYARADDHFEIDYTVKANSEGFKAVINNLRAITKLKFPDTTDVATKDNFYDTLNGLYANVQNGINGLRNDSSTLGIAAQALDTVKQNHLDDTQNMQRLLENTEGADTTDAIVKFQTLQTQLQASYQVTSLLSQLSLTRFLGGG